MRIAVLGVGLIGGSIGLAARRRLEAEVAGFDPDRGLLDRAAELGAVDEAAESAGAAVEGVELAFCAAPVTALPGLAAEALDAAGEDCAVTDVGSVKRDVIAALGAESRFIGGHPLAGAETSGIENARADLFEGARWYLTPTQSTGGLLYDRVQRAISEIGARPQAIEAETHDRLMATISHLPHVLANVLVTQATTALSEESEHLPEVGPSFRDATRVAGANPAIWGDIFAGNREAVAVGDRRSDRPAHRGFGVAPRPVIAMRSAAWHELAARRRRELIETEIAGGPLHELRVLVPNRPGIVAELALELGRAGVNIEDMALYPAADMTSGAISLYVAGDEQAERAERLVRGLGPRRLPGANEVRPGRSASRGPPPAAGQIRLPSGRADRRDGRGPDPDQRLPRLRRHARDAARRRGGRRGGEGGRRSTAAVACSSRSRASGCAARVRPRSTSRTRELFCA